MRSRLLWRRASTAAGLYASVAFGILASIVAARSFGRVDFGIFATALVVAGFFQILLDLTVEDALTKVGFRYVASERWGKLRGLFAAAVRLKLAGGVAAALVIALCAPIADAIFDRDGLGWAVLAAAGLPLVQCTENVSTSALLLHGRYDLRGAYQALSQALRLGAVIWGVRHGVVETIVALVAVQAVSTAVVWFVGRNALARFPSAPREALAEDVPEVRSFVLRSSLATGIVAGRTTFAPLVLGVVAGTTQVGLLRIASTPHNGLSAASAPVRLILLTEQTRDWEHGRVTHVLRGVRRYMAGAALVTLVTVPVFYAALPWLIERIFTADFVDATDAARLMLLAAGVHLVLGWTKSFPTTIGRPGLRILSHGVETAVLLPLTAVFGALWGVTGAAAAFLVSSVAYATVWIVVLTRLRREHRAGLLVRPEGGG